MAIRVKHKVNVRVAEDTDMANLLFAPSDDLAEVVIDSYERAVGGTFAIDADDTQTLPLGDVTLPRGLYLRVDADCKVNVNAMGDLQLRRASTLVGTTAKFFMEGEITSVVITSPTTAAVRGAWCVWGDAVV